LNLARWRGISAHIHSHKAKASAVMQFLPYAIGVFLLTPFIIWAGL
jgi:hypothetical protein